MDIKRTVLLNLLHPKTWAN